MTFAFAVCIGNEQTFRARALAGILRSVDIEVPIAESRDNTSLCGAYNEILDEFATIADLEALVLLHDDVELRDPRFVDKVRAAFEDPSIAVLGAVGASGVRSLSWWEGQGAGGVQETRGNIRFSSGRSDVDAVDGLLLALSPWAVHNLRFATDDFPRFHGYDVDFCFQARAQGKRVVVDDVDAFHHTKGGYGDAEEFQRSDLAFRKKWFGA